MTRQRSVEVTEQRTATPALRWLTLHEPDLAREVRAGQFVMVRCSDDRIYDPPLRRALFVAAANHQLGQIGLLYAPRDDRGLQWLSHRQAGSALDIIGPLGRPFGVEQQTRSLLLIGRGAGLGALIMLASEALARGASATLLAGADTHDLLPPPFLLPPALEYESVAGDVAALYTEQQLAWADQIAAAIPAEDVGALRSAIRSSRVRSARGLVRVLLDGALACGIGVCATCSVPVRQGRRLLCVDGPVFDLRDLAEAA